MNCSLWSVNVNVTFVCLHTSFIHIFAVFPWLAAVITVFLAIALSGTKQPVSVIK